MQVRWEYRLKLDKRNNYTRIHFSANSENVDFSINYNRNNKTNSTELLKSPNKEKINRINKGAKYFTNC